MAFTQALFGKAIMPKKQAENIQSQAGAVADLGDATEKAGKQAKGALAGFDEINVLSKADGGAGAGAVGGIGAIENPVVEEMNDSTSGVMGQMATKAAETAEKIRTAFTNMKNAIVENKDLILPAIGAIAGAIAGITVYTGIENLIYGFKYLRVAVSLAWGTLLKHPMVAIIAAIGALVGAFIVAYKTNDEFRAKVDALGQELKMP